MADQVTQDDVNLMLREALKYAAERLREKAKKYERDELRGAEFSLALREVADAIEESASA